MTNKEKLEIIDKQLNLCYEKLKEETFDEQVYIISKTIYDLETVKLGLLIEDKNEKI